jgi:hypothetical protein
VHWCQFHNGAPAESNRMQGKPRLPCTHLPSRPFSTLLGAVPAILRPALARLPRHARTSRYSCAVTCAACRQLLLKGCSPTPATNHVSLWPRKHEPALVGQVHLHR